MGTPTFCFIPPLMPSVGGAERGNRVSMKKKVSQLKTLHIFLERYSPGVHPVAATRGASNNNTRRAVLASREARSVFLGFISFVTPCPSGLEMRHNRSQFATCRNCKIKRCSSAVRFARTRMWCTMISHSRRLRSAGMR